LDRKKARKRGSEKSSQQTTEEREGGDCEKLLGDGTIHVKKTVRKNEKKKSCTWEGGEGGIGGNGARGRFTLTAELSLGALWLRGGGR